MIVYDFERQPLITLSEHNASINRFKFYNANFKKYLASSSNDSTVKIWDIRYWTLIQTLVHSSLVTGVEFIDDDTIATGSQDIYLWKISTGTQILYINAGSVKVNCLLSVKKQKDLLISGHETSSGMSLRIWNITTSKTVDSKLNNQNGVRDLAMLSYHVIASAGVDKTVIIWNLTGIILIKLHTLKGHTDAVNSLRQISCSVLASGSADKTINVWNYVDGTLVRTLSNHSDYIYYGLESYTNEYQEELIISGSWDGTIKFWSLATGQLNETLSAAGTKINALVLLENNLNSSKRFKRIFSKLINVLSNLILK